MLDHREASEYLGRIGASRQKSNKFCLSLSLVRTGVRQRIIRKQGALPKNHHLREKGKKGKKKFLFKETSVLLDLPANGRMPINL
jgi:hypothetical protein